MFTASDNKNEKFKRLITFTWLILAAIFMAFLLNSCSSTKSIRGGKKDFSKKSQTLEDKKLEEKLNKLKPIEKEVVEDTDDEENLVEDKNIRDFANKIIQKNSITAVQSNTESSSRKIPTLREQMKQLADAQTVIKGQINNLQSDVSEIKESFKSFKKDFIESQTQKKNNNVVFANVSNQISSDEVNDDQYVAPKKETPKTTKAKTSKKAKKIIKKSSSQASNTKSETKKESNKKAEPTKKQKVIAKSNPEKPKQVTEVKKDSETNQNLFDLAMKSFNAHDYNKAIELFNKNLQSESNATKVIDCYYWIGESYYGMKRFDLAIENLNKVIKQKSHSKQGNAQILLAECFTKKGDVAEAKKAYQSFISKYPQSDYIPRAKKMLQQL